MTMLPHAFISPLVGSVNHTRSSCTWTSYIHTCIHTSIHGHALQSSVCRTRSQPGPSSESLSLAFAVSSAGALCSLAVEHNCTCPPCGCGCGCGCPLLHVCSKAYTLPPRLSPEEDLRVVCCSLPVRGCLHRSQHRSQHRKRIN